jgi:hypothetical protein
VNKPPMVKLPIALMQDVVKYLESRPFCEVASLISGIIQTQEKVEEAEKPSE